MRSLTSKQKKLLDEWYRAEKAKGEIIGVFFNVSDDSRFSGQLFEQIDALNPCEIITQNINHYIGDKVSADHMV